MTRQVAEIVESFDRPSRTRAGHHWVFDHVPAFEGLAPAGHEVDYVGSVTAPDLQGGAPAPAGEAWYSPSPPPVDDEYPEWTDLLEAVLDAGDRFTFVELGAGFGRWTARAALAARRRGIPDVRLVMVEGEPLHARWARRHMALNGVTPDQYRLIEAAVGATAGTAPFIVEPPGAAAPEAATAGRWYGQCLASSAHLGNPRRAEGRYDQRPRLSVEGGYTAIEVPVVTLDTVLDGLDRVDLVDMDIQGEEGPLIAANADLLTRAVRRLHVETHSPAVEAEVREALAGAGWVCLRDHSVGTTSSTPFGEVVREGGVQGWLNPRLC